MKKFTLFLILSLCSLPSFSQNITNTLGATGLFRIIDASNDFLTVTQSTGDVLIRKTLTLENTSGATTGVIYKGNNRFIHNFGSMNTFMGENSGNFTMTGEQNTALGHSSLNANTEGSFNTAIGRSSLSSNSTGSSNIAMGYYSLNANTTGSYNIALGIYSLFTSTGSSNNIALGNSSLANNTTGENNIALGNGSNNSTTGSNNMAIGDGAQLPSPTASNQVRIGNNLVSYAGVQVAWTVTSDRRWKENIKSSNLGLGFISKLNPVSYTRINDEKHRVEYGLIAQELEDVLKSEEVGNLGMITIDDKGYYELRYNDLLAPMIKAIQELKKENDDLKTTAIKFQAANEKLTTTTTELTNRLTNFEQMQNILVAEIEKLKTNNYENVKVSLGEK